MSKRGGLSGESFGGELEVLFLDGGAESNPSDGGVGDAGVAMEGKGLFLAASFSGTGGGDNAKPGVDLSFFLNSEKGMFCNQNDDNLKRPNLPSDQENCQEWVQNRNQKSVMCRKLYIYNGRPRTFP